MDFGGSVETDFNATLNLHHAFGVTHHIRDNVVHSSDNSVIYPVGGQIGVQDVETRGMTFFESATNTNSNRQFLSMAISQGSKVLGVSTKEVIGEEIPKYSIDIFHVGTRKFMRAISHPNFNSEFSCLAFSCDEKLIMGLCLSEPESNLFVWKWESQKLIASTKISNRITRIRNHPTKANTFSISGPGYCRMVEVVDGALRMSSMVTGKKEKENFVDHGWIGGSYSLLLLLTERGSVSVVRATENTKAKSNKGCAFTFDFLQSLQCPHVSAGDKFEDLAKSGNATVLANALSNNTPGVPFGKDKDAPPPIRSETIFTHPKGFVVGGGNGYVCVFERNSEDSRERFLFIRSLASGGTHGISSISVAPSSETAVLYTKDRRLIKFPLGNVDVLKPNECFQPINPFDDHFGAIIDIDTCIYKPVLVSASTDKTLKVWNYLSRECLLSQSLNEEPTCLTVHPSGFHVIVGFKERVRIYNIMLGGLSVFREMTLKNCRQVQYSHGGQYFACAIGISVVVFSSYTFDVITNFTGHIGVVRRLSWSANDSVLFSAGADGCVYAWDIQTQMRSNEQSFIHKSCKFSGVAPEKDGMSLATCGGDGMLRMVSSCDVKQEFYLMRDDGNNLALPTTLSLALNSHTVMVGMSDGSVMTTKWPLETAEPHLNRYKCHSSAVSCMVLTRDEQFLFTGASDGTIFMMRLPHEATADSLSKQVHLNLSAVLVSMDSVRDREAKMREIERKANDSIASTKYELHCVKTQQEAELKKITEGFEMELGQEREKFDKLSVKYDETVRENNDTRDKLHAQHIHATTALEERFEKKIVLELTRYDNLSEKAQATRIKCEEMLEEQENKHVQEAKETKEAVDEEIRDFKNKVLKLQKEAQLQQQKFDEMLAQQETEYESEISRLKEHSKDQISREHEATALKQAQVTQLRNKNDALRKRMKEIRDAQQHSHSQCITLEDQVKKLTREVEHMKVHLDERDLSLGDKEKEILQLRSSNRTLDNFRVVLDDQIKTLTKERGPSQDKIVVLESSLATQEDELLQQFNRTKKIERQLLNKDLKLESTTQELTQLRSMLMERDRKIISFGTEMESLIHCDAQHLRARALEMHRKFSKESKRNKGDSQSLAMEEAVRQRDYMEKTTATMKKTLDATRAKHDKDTQRRLKENALLLKECNSLRRETTEQRLKIDELKERLRSIDQRKAAKLAARRSSQVLIQQAMNPLNNNSNEEFSFPEMNSSTTSQLPNSDNNNNTVPSDFMIKANTPDVMLNSIKKLQTSKSSSSLTPFQKRRLKAKKPVKGSNRAMMQGSLFAAEALRWQKVASEQAEELEQLRSTLKSARPFSAMKNKQEPNGHGLSPQRGKNSTNYNEQSAPSIILNNSSTINMNLGDSNLVAQSTLTLPPYAMRSVSPSLAIGSEDQSTALPMIPLKSQSSLDSHAMLRCRTADTALNSNPADRHKGVKGGGFKVPSSPLQMMSTFSAGLK